jgi:DNA ligase-4
MSLERKYDGEYCQIHIDLTRRPDCIQIFSKSGKDSTADKRGIHKTVVDCLRIGQNDCKFSDRCILEGELLVWSDTESEILGFHKLRKHISRSGSFLGTESDSQYVSNVT